jgi:hypothetical protein
MALEEQAYHGRGGARPRETPRDGSRPKFVFFSSLLALCIFVAFSVALPCFIPGLWARINRCDNRKAHPWMARSPPPQPPRYDIAVTTVLDDFLSPVLRERTGNSVRAALQRVAPRTGGATVISRLTARIPPS